MNKLFIIILIFPLFLNSQTLRLSSLIEANAFQYSLGNATLVKDCDKSITFTVTNTSSSPINRAIKLFRISTTGVVTPQSLVSHAFTLAASGNPGSSLTFNSSLTQVGTNQIPTSNGLGGTTGSPAGTYDFLLVGNTATTPLSAFDLNSITISSPTLWTTSTSFNNPQAVTIQPSGLSTTPTISAASTSVATGNSTTINITSGTLGFGCDWKYSTSSCRNIPNTIISGTSFSSGSITSPTTFYVWGNHCNTNSLSTSLNTLCDNVTITNIPCSKPSTPSTPSAGTPACSQNILTRSTSPPTGVVWYWQTTASGMDMSFPSATYTATSNGTYYLRAYETTNGGCWSDASSSVSATVLSYSSSPSSISASANPINYLSSSNLSVVGGALGSSANWVWYSGSCGTSTPIGTGVSITVSPTSTTDYCVRAEGTCGNSFSATKTITVNNNNTLGINISSSTMAPWQREGDIYTGSITITSTPNFYPWKVEVLRNGNIIHTYNISTNNTLSVSINSNDFLNSYITGDVISYRASYQDNLSQKLLNSNTNIIDRKWDKPTVLFNNSLSDPFIKIPIKWESGIDLNNFKVIVTRISDNYNLVDKEISNLIFPYTRIFNVSSDGYTYLKKSTSSIADNRPGDFKIEVKKNTTIIETDSFEFVKYGKINTNTSSSKALIFIGGWNSDIEEDINKSTNDGSLFNDMSFSIGKIPIWNNHYKTFYIGQSNSNFTQVNAFAIGKALSQIYLENGITEIHIVTHSKGGLETKTLLAGLSLSYKDKNINYYNFQYKINEFSNMPSLNSLNIKKVVFLATPHKGGNPSSLTFNGILNGSWDYFIASPAYKELAKYSDFNFLDYLNNKKNINVKMPSNVVFANLTMYRDILGIYYYKGKISSNGISFNDLALDGNSSDCISNHNSIPTAEKQLLLNNLNQPINNVLQMYQHSNEILSMAHSKAHVNLSLTNKNSKPYSIINQTESIVNLNKIIAFLLNSPHNIPTCPRPTQDNLNFNSVGSIISGSKISCKLKFDTSNIYYPFGVTDAKGRFQGKIIPDFSYWDSLRIEANNMEKMTISIDSNTFKTGKLIVPMFYKSTPDVTVINPILKIVDEIPLEDTNVTALYISGTNVTSYNYRINSIDSPFQNLTLSANKAEFPLEYGLNLIEIMYCGVDTVYQSKNIWYYPDSAIQDETKSLTLSNVNTYKNIDIYVDGVFWKSLIKDTTLLVPKFSREIKCIKQGYLNLISRLTDTSTILNITLTPHDYISKTDSGLLNFTSQNNIQFWKNTSLKLLSSQSTVITTKQVEVDTLGLGLKPVSRLFKFENLSTNSNVRSKTAIILDQIDSPEISNIYLYTKKDTSYKKYLLNIDSTKIYHSDVQKIGFDSLDFQSPNSKFELCLTKKLAPITLNTVISFDEDQTIDIPISDLIIDPDSIPNDFIIQLDSFKSGITATIVGKNLHIVPTLNFNGSTQVSLSAIHDWIKISKNFVINIKPVNDTPILKSLPNYTFCSGHLDSVQLDSFMSDVDNLSSELTLIVDSISNSNSSISLINLSNYIIGHTLYFKNQYRATNISYFVRLKVNDGNLNSLTRVITLKSLATTYSSYIDTICKSQFKFGHFKTGIYYDTLVSLIGCDSVRKLDLFVKDSSAFHLHQKFCTNKPRFFNGNYLTKSGIYRDTFVNSIGCDSFLSLHLYEDLISTSIINDTICDGDTIYFKNLKIYTNGTFKDTLKNSGGCDSFIIVNVFKALKKILIIDIVNNSLIAPSFFRNYYWYYKNNHQPVQIKNIYNISNYGEYYLKAVDSLGCSYKSNVINFNNSSLTNSNYSNYAVYPNPTSSILNIDFDKYETTNLKLSNLLGQVLMTKLLPNQKNQIDISSLSKGVYLIELTNSKGEKYTRGVVIE